jgi:hypothetical protein
MSEAQKDTIYIDVDDEITGIIDKVQTSKHKIVALVLPKRATVLQSVVNMKLLKRNADKAKKSLVLITSEAGLMPLAGAVGLHVAKNLQSKPAIPAGPEKDEVPESLVNEEELETEDDEPSIDDKKSIGELAGVAAVAAATPEAEETINLDDAEEVPAATKAAKGVKPKKDKKLKVPNFERFRKWLILGGFGLLILIVGGIYAFKVMPRAHIVISTDTTTLNSTITFTANTTSKTFDEAAKSVPAQTASSKKTDTQNAPATGQKNIGNKATGTVSMSAKVCNSISTPSSVSSGSGISANGLTYITQQDVTFTFDSISGGCINFKSNGTTITAQNGGANYNTATTTFAVAGRADVSSSGSANGGTDNVVKVVSQADVDAAKAKINTSANSDAAKAELTTNLKKDGMYPISSSLTTDGPNVTSSPNVGDQADSVAVTGTTTFTMLGVNQANMTQLVDNQLKAQIDTSKQSVLDNGLNSATFTVNGKDNPQVSVQTSATIGPSLDTDAIKKEVAGKKKGDTIDIISNRPGIKGVTVNYSPFWVSKTPSDPKKVIITFQKAN